MISDELIPIACHPKRRWKFCMSEDKTKRNKTDFCWVMLWMYTIREYFVTETPYEYLVILTVQFFYLSYFFWDICLKIHIWKISNSFWE